METTPTLTTSKAEKRRTEQGRKEKEKKIKIENPAMGILESMKEAVHNALTNCEPGNELETLVQTLKHDIQQQVQDDILAAFHSYYPGKFESGQLHLFGSHVMGIAFKDSDLDFYVELPTRDQQRSKNARNKRIRNLLERSKKFANFESITRPRIPLIRCTHIGTLISCDFNSSNQLGSLNSSIIAHLLQFDPRIHKLAIVIKYWMKIHDCSGENRLSNYAITWMLIFYLQTLPQPIVPPIEEFQRNVPPRMVSHYNYAFDDSLPNLTNNESQWPELLLGFFKFYRDFDYGTQLISPLYGKTFSKVDVEQKKLTEFQRYEKILLTGEENAMYLDKNNFCIQDPFEITRKVPGVIPNRSLVNIISKIGYAAEILEREIQQGDRKSLLLQIFDVAKFDELSNKPREIRILIDPAAYSNRSISRTSTIFTNDRNTNMKLQLEPTNFLFQHEVRKNVADNCSVQTDAHLIRKMWAKEVIEMISDILRDIFLLDVTGVGCDDDESSNNESSDEFVKKFHLKGARDLFVGRKQKRFTWNEEVLYSSQSFDRTSKLLPFDVSANITADTVNFNYISIEFNDKIKRRRANYYKAFCAYFTQRLDYYLEIYFAHRNKSSIDTVNEAKNMQLLAQPAEQMTISSPFCFKLLPTEFTLTSLLTNKNYCEEVKQSQVSIKQLWAQEVIKMIPDILRDIFKLQLHIEKSDTYMRNFRLTGSCCKFNYMFSGRKGIKLPKSVNDNMWINEVQESSRRFEAIPLNSDVPLKSYVMIGADVKNFEYVTIDVRDQIGKKKNNFFKTFCKEFFTRINYLQKIYFVRRDEMDNKVAKAAKQYNSASTLSSTLIVYQDVRMSQDTHELEPTEIMPR